MLKKQIMYNDDDQEGADATNLFVGNISRNVSNEEFLDMFTAHGELDMDKSGIKFDRDTGRSRGFGFIKFMNAEEATAAVDALDGTEVDGREMRVMVAKPRDVKPRDNSYGY